MALLPSWKDRIVTIGEDDESVRFRILVSNTVIYEGVAQPDDDGLAQVNIRDIMADQLALIAPSFTRNVTRTCEGITVSYSLQFYDETDEEWEAVESGTFIIDYSYDTGRSLNLESSVFMHAPVITRAAQWQVLFYEALDITPVRISRDSEAYSTLGSTAKQLYSEVFGGEPRRSADVSTLTIYQDAGRGLTWTAACGDYALYYANALGGWDSLLLEGNCTRSAAVERSTFAKAYDNGTVTNANANNYQNAVTDKYTLRTGWLTDDESSRMFHLLGSTQVFLHDHERDLILPVRLTDISFDYKTFKSQGGKLIQYTMNATVLRDYIRR